MNQQMPNPDSIPVYQNGYTLLQYEKEFFLKNLQRLDLISISDTAALIWGLCDGIRTMAEIQEMLCQAYPESADLIPEDVKRILGELTFDGCIKWR